MNIDGNVCVYIYIAFSHACCKDVSRTLDDYPPFLRIRTRKSGKMRGTRYLLLPAVIPGALSALCTPLACSVVHVFLIRGTNDPYPGRQLPTAEGICENWDCSWSNIEYPAVFNDYCESVETGIANLGKAVADYATRCPDSKIVLSGHSQGGQVVGDYLGGGGGNMSSLGCAQQTSKGISPEAFPADHSKRIS
jgi:hypothetical protein